MAPDNLAEAKERARRKIRYRIASRRRENMVRS
jgi:hypothetical protein